MHAANHCHQHPDRAAFISCGRVAGLIHDILTVKVLIDRIMSEAGGIIRHRLASLVGG